MRTRARHGWRGLVALAASACTGVIPGVTPHDIRFDAAALERDRCDPTPVDPRLYGPLIVRKVSPYYRYVMGGPNGREAHLAGAELEVQPLAGVTLELLERGLMCRSAKVMLGHAAPAPDEPYAFPDSWVKIDVSSGGGVFIVRLSAEEPGRAKELLDHARAFASAPSP